MKKVILIFVTIVLSGLLYAKDNKSTDALLREIDGIIKNRQTYGAEKEARIADLKKLLAEATSDEQRYGFCGRLGPPQPDLRTGDPLCGVLRRVGRHRGQSRPAG